MKNLLVFIILSCIARFAASQTRVTNVSEPSLKGKVKRVVTYTFRGVNNTAPDKTLNAEKTIETFDEKGWPQETKMYDTNGELQERFSFEYIGDSIIVKKQFDGSGKFFVKYVFKYDREGKETEFDINSDAQPQFRLAKIDAVSIYKYDELGNRISQDQYIDHDKLSLKTNLSYNDRHQKIQSDEESFYDNLHTKTKTIFNYDKAGNLIRSQIYDADGKLTRVNTITYDNFDKYGNPLTETLSFGGHNNYQGDVVFTNVTKRIIKYY